MVFSFGNGSIGGVLKLRLSLSPQNEFYTFLSQIQSDPLRLLHSALRYENIGTSSSNQTVAKILNHSMLY